MEDGWLVRATMCGGAAFAGSAGAHRDAARRRAAGKLQQDHLYGVRCQSACMLVAGVCVCVENKQASEQARHLEG
jgi:hypothetical protein